MKKIVKEFAVQKRASKKISKLSDAQRLLAKYIQMYERDEISDSKLRTLSYSVKTFAEISKIQYLEVIEERLTKLEKANDE